MIFPCRHRKILTKLYHTMLKNLVSTCEYCVLVENFLSAYTKSHNGLDIILIGVYFILFFLIIFLSCSYSHSSISCLYMLSFVFVGWDAVSVIVGHLERNYILRNFLNFRFLSFLIILSTNLLMVYRFFDDAILFDNAG